MPKMPISTSLKQNDFFIDSGSSRVLLCGKSFVADSTGALYWRAEDILIVSDLHLEKGSYLTEEKVTLPPYDIRSGFEKLEEAIDRYEPHSVIAVGDSFCGGASLSFRDIDWLKDLMEDREWRWVVGESGQPIPESVGGVICAAHAVANIKLRYEPTRAPVSHEIAGRMHPVARVREYDHTTRSRCFVSNGLRLILPSMGDYSAGLNVLDDTFAPLLGRDGLYVWAAAEGKVYPVSAGQLVEEGVA
jgi:DNA ligase-associated metallophosphoesterase